MDVKKPKGSPFFIFGTVRPEIRFSQYITTEKNFNTVRILEVEVRKKALPFVPSEAFTEHEKHPLDVLKLF